MPRIRMEFTKGDGVRFLSHLDLVKAFERAIRRAEIPIAFSEGFNPHPKMNFASALAVGVTSDAEYIDIELKDPLEPNQVAERLGSALPPEITITSAAAIPDNAPALMAQVNRAVYQVAATAAEALEQVQLDREIARYMDLAEVTIVKKTKKKGQHIKNIRPGILGFNARVLADKILFELTVAITNEGAVRPEEVVRSFIDLSGLPLEGDALNLRRTGLYIEKNGTRYSPMEREVIFC